MNSYSRRRVGSSSKAIAATGSWTGMRNLPLAAIVSDRLTDGSGSETITDARARSASRNRPIDGGTRGAQLRPPEELIVATAEPVRLALRKLWSDHVIWTREYIVAAVAGTPDASAAAGRLLKNQQDIGGAIVPYYGQGAGDALTGLLKAHILIAVDLIEAAKANDQAAFARHDARWSANIGEIAKLLAGANPHWPEKDVLDLLALHLKLTTGEVVARLTKDWAADVKAFDDIFTEIMVVADTLHDGLVAQFPDRFAAKAG